MALNVVVLSGRLTRDPEIRYTSEGTPVAKFSIAVDRNQAPDPDGNRPVDFIDCVAFRQSAEYCGKYLQKGDLVAVDGKIQVRKWQTQAGEKRNTTEIVADRVEGIGGKKKDKVDSGPNVDSGSQVDNSEDQDHDDPFGAQ